MVYPFLFFSMLICFFNMENTAFVLSSLISLRIQDMGEDSLLKSHQKGIIKNVKDFAKTELRGPSVSL